MQIEFEHNDGEVVFDFFVLLLNRVYRQYRHTWNSKPIDYTLTEVTAVQFDIIILNVLALLRF